MKPIGIRFKQDGELMVVHRCMACSKNSNNRIAGDDIPEVILALADGQSSEYREEIRIALYGRA